MRNNSRQVAKDRRLEQRFLTLAGNRADFPVPNAATSLSVSLQPVEFDSSYGVVATPSWDTTVWIDNKTDSGFDLNFGTAAPDANQVVHVATFREV